jgi:Tol biopolymer transport system component
VADQNRLGLVDLATGDRKWITQPASAEGYDLNPRLSPDGRQIIFVRARSNHGQMDIVTVDVNGGDVRPVFTEPGFNHNPIWIAEGKDIVFNPQFLALFRVPASGGKAVRIPESDDSVATAAYSHASHRLVYSRRIEDMNIWSLNLAKGAKPERIIAATRRDFSAQPSPHGDRLAFTSDRTGTWQIWTSAIDGGRQTQLTAFETSIADGARWSPDGKQIVFSGLINGNRDIYLIGAEGGTAKRLTTEASDEGRPWFSGDGKSIYFRSNRSGGEEIWSMPAAGGPAVQITRGGGFDVQESPDGALIYFTRGRNIAGLWQSRPDGTGALAVAGMDNCRGSLWAVSKAGIYFLDRGQDGAWTLFRRELKKQTGEPILSIDAPLFLVAPVLSTTPDGSRVVWNQSDQSGADLVLIENFR